MSKDRVPPKLRRAEAIIDAAIPAMALWRASKSRLVQAALDLLRDATEAYMLLAFEALVRRGHDFALDVVHQQSRFQAGTLQLIKWALIHGSESGTDAVDEILLYDANQIAQRYEVLVDTLHSAKVGQVDARVDETRSLITVYEGGDESGFDHGIIDAQRRIGPFQGHVRLTEPDDRLTTHWSARHYAAAAAYLRSIAAAAVARETLVFAPPGVEPIDVGPRPKVVSVSRHPDPAVESALEDMTLSLARLQPETQWRFVDLFDTPLVRTDEGRFGVSSIIETLDGPAQIDHMLRLARLVDERQYVRVSQLREARMVNACKEELTSRGWAVTPHARVGQSRREIDVLAERGADALIVQLKSTLRPITPKEVWARNSDLLGGIAQARDCGSLFESRSTLIVVTDGYRGNYHVWADALRSPCVYVCTLEDMKDVAIDVGQGVSAARARAGLTVDSPSWGSNEREFELFGWTVRLVDECAPM